MKNFIKLFVVVLALAFVFISCEKGGTIQVTNNLSYPTYVIIVKGADFAKALADLANNKGTLIDKGKTKEFSFGEDGIYTVTATNPLPSMIKSVTLMMGSSEKVPIK